MTMRLDCETLNWSSSAINELQAWHCDSWSGEADDGLSLPCFPFMNAWPASEASPRVLLPCVLRWSYCCSLRSDLRVHRKRTTLGFSLLARRCPRCTAETRMARQQRRAFANPSTTDHAQDLLRIHPLVCIKWFQRFLLFPLSITQLGRLRKGHGWRRAQSKRNAGPLS